MRRGDLYFRLTKTKATPVLQLVHGYRDSSGKSKQKVVASLGDLDLPEALRKQAKCETRASTQNPSAPAVGNALQLGDRHGFVVKGLADDGAD